MEYFTFLRSLHRVIAWKLHYEAIVTDQHPQVMKFLSMLHMLYLFCIVLHAVNYSQEC